MSNGTGVKRDSTPVAIKRQKDREEKDILTDRQRERDRDRG